MKTLTWTATVIICVLVAVVVRWNIENKPMFTSEHKEVKPPIPPPTVAAQRKEKPIGIPWPFPWPKPGGSPADVMPGHIHKEVVQRKRYVVAQVKE